MFGAGILWQRGGIRFIAAQMAQGFGGTSGFGLLLGEKRQTILYVAAGKYRGWSPDHYFSLSQGFGYGMRPFAGGGIGVLCDLKGEDHYVADVYGQGASYWYSAGCCWIWEATMFMRRISIVRARVLISAAAH